MRSSDTDTAAREQQLASYRSMTGTQRLVIALEMSDDVRHLALAGIAHRYPHFDASERRAELVRLLGVSKVR